MLKQIVGDVDLFSAAVLIAIVVSIGIYFTTWVSTRRSKQALEMEHELNQTKQRDATTLEEKRIMGKYALEQKKVDQGMITSHSRRGDGDGEG